jgi:hypothetical protein
VPSERARVIALLDELQASERAGAEALGEWLGCCRDQCLRGGLRVIRARDAAHAALAEARLRSLGGMPTAQVNRNLTALCGVIGAAEVSDRSKVAILLARFPTRGYDPFADVVLQIEHDSETRALLEAIGDDERVTLDWLRVMRDAHVRPARGDAAEESASLVHFLDALRAAEAAAAEVLAAWIAVCAPAGLRGGLRAIAARETVHAALLTERLRELGGSPQVAVPAAVRATALATFGARDVGDDAKVARLLSRYPEDADAVQPIADVADHLHGDLETRELLRLVAAGEGATVRWLRAYHIAMGDDLTSPRAHGA